MYALAFFFAALHIDCITHLRNFGEGGSCIASSQAKQWEGGNAIILSRTIDRIEVKWHNALHVAVSKRRSSENTSACSGGPKGLTSCRNLPPHGAWQAPLQTYSVRRNVF